VRLGQQQRLLAGQRHAKKGRGVEVGHKDKEVDVLAAALDRGQQRAGVGPLEPHPLQLLRLAVRPAEDGLGEGVKGADVAGLVDAKAQHPHAIEQLDAGLVVVGPAQVVAGAGRQHLDLVARRQQLGQHAALQLGAAVDVEPVALDNKRQSQQSLFIIDAPRRHGGHGV
jgi:hypothetical protein